MIKIWKVKVKFKNMQKVADTIVFEKEEKLIVWKTWIAFAPAYDFFHQRILRQDYSSMEMLLKIGTYSCLHSAKVIGINPHMLSFITNYERHAIVPKLRKLATLGYINFTQPTLGNTSETNITLNEYCKNRLKIFNIDRTWLKII